MCIRDSSRAGGISTEQLERLYKENTAELRYISSRLSSLVQVQVTDDRTEIKKRQQLLA
jgi:hypothetical protein